MAYTTKALKVRNRWSGDVQFVARVAVGLSRRAQIGAAVKWALGKNDNVLQARAVEATP